MAGQRNFNTISPSAKTLLLLKSATKIPFAKEAVHVVFTEEERKPQDVDSGSRKAFFGRLLHFENRYWSIDHLMRDTGIKNIMEISSGFSFRGLDKVLHEDVFYIDTDLPDLIDDKKEILIELLQGKKPKGKLITEPLNVLEEDHFLELVNQFPPGPVCIINEGLLMYLNPEEKGKLAAIIHKVLAERGGCWITADIYIKNADAKPVDYSIIGQKFAEFLEAHHVEENKFESLDAAREFFTQAGFTVEKTNKIAYDKLSSLRLLQGKVQVTEDIVKEWLKIRETWMLTVKK
jgi:hypothetical protein